jgi:acetolactate decarboxylase
MARKLIRTVTLIVIVWSHVSQMKRKTIPWIALLVVVACFLNCTHPATQTIASEPETIDREMLFQTSTMQALLAGSFDGNKTVGELRNQGDMGIGVFNGLDGEMIALEGQFYQVKEDGQAFSVSDQMKTPFAVVTFFDVEYVLLIENGPTGFAALRKSLDTLITDKNVFYAIKIDGEFASIKIRSVPAQQKPYRKLLEVIKNDQKIQDLKNVKGTMVGFWFPVYSGGINISRYHFHFISKNRKRGGHVLDCTLRKGTVAIDLTPKIQIELLTKRDQE